jgi:uncharacterized membrane protein
LSLLLGRAISSVVKGDRRRPLAPTSRPGGARRPARLLASSRVRRLPAIRLFTAIVAVIAIATAIGMAILWPGEVTTQIGEAVATDSEQASVQRITEYRCQGFNTQTCQRVTIRIESGAKEGDRSQLLLGVGGVDPEVDVGDQLRVIENIVPPGGSPEAAGLAEYSLSDFERRTPILVLVLIFAALVVVLGRARGALSLLGLALSLGVILVFVVPAILDGKSPLAVAIVGSSAVMLATILLAHGTGPKSLAAIVGTSMSLLLTAGLAVLFTNLTNLTGLSSEEATFLQVNQGNLSLEGLLLAGMVIGALGVLDDVTISQSSTVMALRAANPAQTFRQLFGRAMDVGRDHVSATVNTLVLAYVGASLPLLLIFSSTSLGFGETVNLELIAKEVVATLVGSIGLIAAVPITTATAALLARNVPAEALEGEEHHAHSH